MDAPIKIEGICCTCEYRSDCQILRRSQAKGKVIWHCEEFYDPDDSTKEERERKNPVVMKSNNLIPGWDR